MNYPRPSPSVSRFPWGARVFRLRDPDGFRLAISSERSLPPRHSPASDGTGADSTDGR